MPGTDVRFALVSNRRWLAGVAAIFCLVLGGAAVEQHAVGWNELSHFAQIRAFDHGTPRIDRWRHTTGDRAVYHHHFYSDKAPGLAMLDVGVYRVARVVKLTHGDGYGTLHLMVLAGCGLPLLILLLLAYRQVEAAEPGRGAVTAVMLGLGTILFPFSTLLFSHVLSACLGFGAYLLLRRERDRRAEHGDGWWLIAGAGALGGYAIGTEYPLGLLVALLGLFAMWRPRSRVLLGGAAFGAGALVGLLPLFAYDWWAFGSPLHLSYQYVSANSSGVLGLGAPSLKRAVMLLTADRGLFVVTPLLAAGIGGIVILWREGRRLDALVPAVVGLAYLVYNAGYYLPFGGSVPGPRFLITALPFFALPLAAAYRRAPLATLSLAAVSAATMVVATVTLPILSTYTSTRIWWTMFSRGEWTTRGSTIWACFALLVLAVLLCAWATARPRVTRSDLILSAFGVGSWLALRTAGPALLAHDVLRHEQSGLVVLVALGLALAVVGTYLARGRSLALLAGVPLVALAFRSLDTTGAALALVAISLALAVAVTRPGRMAV